MRKYKRLLEDTIEDYFEDIVGYIFKKVKNNYEDFKIILNTSSQKQIKFSGNYNIICTFNIDYDFITILIEKPKGASQVNYTPIAGTMLVKANYKNVNPAKSESIVFYQDDLKNWKIILDKFLTKLPKKLGIIL